MISKGSDKNMLVPNMSPDWQFIALRGPDVKSHMLIFSTEQASGLHCKMHHRHMLIFSTQQSSGLCCRMHHRRRALLSGERTAALKDKSPFRRTEHLLQQLAEGERGLLGLLQALLPTPGILRQRSGKGRCNILPKLHFILT